MELKKLLEVKKVETKVDVITRKVSINITKGDIDKLNQDIVNNIARNEIERKKGLEIAEKCVMK